MYFYQYILRYLAAETILILVYSQVNILLAMFLRGVISRHCDIILSKYNYLLSIRDNYNND